MRALRRTAVTVACAAALVGGTAAAATASLTGPDVSKWQHPNGTSIDWTKVKASGQSFAFIKATEGPGPRNNNTWYTNEWFAKDWAAAGSVGLARGAYHYAQPSGSTDDAVRQARYYVAATGTMHGGHDLPPVLDLEEDNGASASQLVAWAKAWLAEVQRLTGRAPMIYTYLNFWQTKMANTAALSSYRLWFARYTNDPSQVVPPGGWSTWTFWQYTATGSIPGISGQVDVSRYCCADTNLAALANGAAANDFASNPFGRWDSSLRQPGGLSLRGWAIDPDTTDPISVHAYVDGHYVQQATAGQPSNDVARAYPGFGNTHRFDTTVPMVGGKHQVCVWAINVGYGHGNPKIECKDVDLAVVPFGNVETLSRAPGGVTVGGWAIDPDVADPVVVHLTVDGKVVTGYRASDVRTDVGKAYAGYGDQHGFHVTVPVSSPGPHAVCAYAINLSSGTVNPNIGCRTLTISTAPFGHLDEATIADGSLHVRGWVIDPNTAAPAPVSVLVDGTAVATGAAGTTRTDVGRAYPAYGDTHGFDQTVAPVSAGHHHVCVLAGSTTVGCKDL